MHRHFSVGVTTIAALMAAHRAASGREGPPAAFCQEEVARISAYLRAGEASEAVAADSPRGAPRRQPVLLRRPS